MNQLLRSSLLAVAATFVACGKTSTPAAPEGGAAAEVTPVAAATPAVPPPTPPTEAPAEAPSQVSALAPPEGSAESRRTDSKVPADEPPTAAQVVR